MGRNENRFLLSTLLMLGICVLSGCSDRSRAGLRALLSKAGAGMIDRSSDDDLKRMFAAANAACPTRMDCYTTLEEVEMIDDRRVEYRYLISGTAAKLASRLDKLEMKRAAVAYIKGNPMAVAIAQRDLSVEHIYRDAAGNRVVSFIINRDVLDGDLQPVGKSQSNPFDVTPVKTVAAGADACEGGIDQNCQRADRTGKSLPRPHKPSRPTKENPAGVQTNPFVQQS